MTDTAPLSDERPLRVAIVGSGPAGFYAADALLKADPPAEVDVIERLPTPWGLVRLGVAPDHPKLKEVSRAFERIAARPGFRFFGNVEVGRAVTHDDLTRLYDAVIYAVGAQTDRRLGIPGEDLRGSWSATEFVAWYNGHPDFQDLDFDLNVERAVVVGAGNVALDVVRMLALTRDELAITDATDASIEAISASPIRDLIVLGRRGPAQAAFTTPELKELGELAGADVDVDPAQLELDPASEASLATDTNARRNVEVLRDYAAREPAGRSRTIRLRFCVSPVAIHGVDRVEAIEIVRNELVAEESGNVRAVATDERETIPCGLVFRSIGYQAVALPGLPFDERRGVIPNEDGRVVDTPRTYVAGWIKRGPSGVIGTNKKCASDTVTTMLADLEAGRLEHGDPAAAETIADELRRRQPELVTYAGWQAIDEAERSAGEPQGRPRVKFTRMDELLDAAGVRSGQPAAR